MDNSEKILKEIMETKIIAARLEEKLVAHLKAYTTFTKDTARIQHRLFKKFDHCNDIVGKHGETIARLETKQKVICDWINDKKDISKRLKVGIVIAVIMGVVSLLVSVATNGTFSKSVAYITELIH